MEHKNYFVILENIFFSVYVNSVCKELLHKVPTLFIRLFTMSTWGSQRMS